ncbi:MAG TPA: complex I NDUFA9 subunit family protein [Caulobacteraceae bacterium]|nr:complex I NDUFA9 subunit family protein [Caulobacteraceae bacterium]
MHGLVTVFGGSGFIGAQVTRALAKQGYRVRVAVRRPGLGYRLPLMGDVGQIEVVQANLRNPESIGRALDGAEGCINLVGVLYETGRQGFAGLHAQGAEQIAAACAARGVKRMVQVSAIGADSQSSSKYARTKAQGEAAVLKLLPQAAIVRPSVVFGVDDALFNRFAAMASLMPVLPLPGGGETKFQPVFVGDVAAAIVAALREPSAAGKIFEIGGPDIYSYRQLIELTLAQIHKSRLLVNLPWGMAKLIGQIGDLQAKLLPVPPVLTADQVELLQHDNIASKSLPGLKALGVSAPVAVEAIIPTYLYRYRRGGQFAPEPAAAEA